MSSRRIVAAYFFRSTAGPVQAHSGWLFVDDRGRVIVMRGGAENEPRAEHFGSVVGPAASARFGFGSQDNIHDMGRLLVTTQELAEVRPRTADRRSPDEDRQTFTLDTVNFLSVVQGQGLIQIPGQVIGGLVTRSNVVITPITQDRARAQALFDAALDINRMLDRAEFAYAIFPQIDGRTGINSHTVSSLVAERADQIARARGITDTNFLASVGGQSTLLTGSSTARPFMAGPDYTAVYGLTNAQFDGRADRGRWSADVHLLRPRLPTDQLMPPSQGILPPRGEIDPRFTNITLNGNGMDGADDGPPPVIPPTPDRDGDRSSPVIQDARTDGPRVVDPPPVRAANYHGVLGEPPPRRAPPRPTARVRSPLRAQPTPASLCPLGQPQPRWVAETRVFNANH